jgi:hypothetical protein
MSVVATSIHAHQFIQDAVATTRNDGPLLERRRFIESTTYRNLILCMFIHHLRSTPIRTLVPDKGDCAYFTPHVDTHIFVCGDGAHNPYGSFSNGCMMVRLESVIVMCFVMKTRPELVAEQLVDIGDQRGRVNAVLLSIAVRMRPHVMSGLRLLQRQGKSRPVVVAGFGIGGALALTTLASIPMHRTTDFLVNEVVLFGAPRFGDRQASRKIEGMVTSKDTNIVLGADPTPQRFDGGDYSPLPMQARHLLRRELQVRKKRPFLPPRSSRPRKLWEKVRQVAGAVWHGRRIDGSNDADIGAYILAMSSGVDLFGTNTP